MADPFAPPTDAPRRRGRAAPEPVPAYRPEPTRPEPTPWEEPRATRDDRVPDPARPGTFWLVAAVGVGLVCLGSLVSFFTYMGDLDGEAVAPALFGVFGTIALAIGLALAAVLQRGLSMGVRTALLLGAGYFATTASGFGIIASLSRGPFF